jgi:hypothetical protein
MRTRLVSRLERLEARPGLSPHCVFQYGWIRPLSKAFIGERHVVVVKRKPTGSPNFEWCQFEERPGPAPVDLDPDGPTDYSERERE